MTFQECSFALSVAESPDLHGESPRGEEFDFLLFFDKLFTKQLHFPLATVCSVYHSEDQSLLWNNCEQQSEAVSLSLCCLSECHWEPKQLSRAVCVQFHPIQFFYQLFGCLCPLPTGLGGRVLSTSLWLLDTTSGNRYCACPCEARILGTIFQRLETQDKKAVLLLIQ